MTPDEMRRAAVLLENVLDHDACAEESDDLARLLREEADANDPTKPRRPVETCPHCGGTGWVD